MRLGSYVGQQPRRESRDGPVAQLTQRQGPRLEEHHLFLNPERVALPVPVPSRPRAGAHATGSVSAAAGASAASDGVCTWPGSSTAATNPTSPRPASVIIAAM